MLIVFPPFPPPRTQHSPVSRNIYDLTNQARPVCLTTQPPVPPPLPFLLGIWFPLVSVLGSLCPQHTGLCSHHPRLPRPQPWRGRGRVCDPHYWCQAKEKLLARAMMIFPLTRIYWHFSGKLGADQFMEGVIMTHKDRILCWVIVCSVYFMSPFYRVVLCKNTREKQTDMRAKTKITRKNK